MNTGVSRKRAALAGVLAAGGGVAVAELLAGVLGVRDTPVTAIGQGFIDVVPGWLERSAIRLFGTADKAVLIGGILLVLALVAAGVGVLTARRRRLGLAVIVLIGGLAALVSAMRPNAGALAAVPGLAAGATALVLLPVLLRRFGADADESTTGAAGKADDATGAVPRRAPDRPQPSRPEPGRRDVVKVGGAVVAGSVLAAGAGRLLGGDRANVEEARETLRFPRPPSVAVPPGAEAGRAARTAGLSPWRTDNDVFYRIDTALRVPVIAPEQWRLRIHGMVDRPFTLTFADLLRRPVVHRWITLTCVSNEVGGDLVGNALWSGVRIEDVLREAGLRPEADAVLSTSEDGWTCGTPLTALTDGRDALLAFAMNGAPLPVEHGFPVRMVVPGLYGFVSATKWVVDLEVTRFDRIQAFWTTRGWSERAPIKTASRIDVPRSGGEVTAGRVVVAGVAWAQHRGIAKVEVRVDDGPWQEARLAGQPTKDAWRQWTWTWEATPGEHRLQARATDGTGRTQTATPSPPAPDGATGYPTVLVTVT